MGRGQPLGDLGSSAALDAAVSRCPNSAFRALDAVRRRVLRVLEKKPYDPVAFEKEKAALVARSASSAGAELFRAYLAEARKRSSAVRSARAE